MPFQMWGAGPVIALRVTCSTGQGGLVPLMVAHGSCPMASAVELDPINAILKCEKSQFARPKTPGPNISRRCCNGPLPTETACWHGWPLRPPGQRPQMRRSRTCVRLCRSGWFAWPVPFVPRFEDKTKDHGLALQRLLGDSAAPLPGQKAKILSPSTCFPLCPR